MVLLALWLGLARTVVYAQTEPQLRVLILEGPGAEWLRRVRGQLSDLPVSILTLPLVVEGQAEADVVRQLGPLATNRDAALVAWLMTDASRYDPDASADTSVAIWFASSGRLFMRRLGPPWQRLSRSDRSGVLEIGALSVRSAVRSLLLDPKQADPPRPESSAPDAATATAVAQSRAAAQSAARAAEQVARQSTGAESPGGVSAPSAAQRAEPAPAQRAQGTASASAVPPSTGAEPPSDEGLPPALVPDEGRIVTSSRAALDSTPAPSDRGSADDASGVAALALGWSAELGLSGQLAGPPGFAAAGIGAGLRATSGAWALGLLGRFGLPLRSELGPSELSLQHHALLAEVEYLRWSWGALTLGPLVRGGLALTRRETVSGPTELEAAGAAWSRSVQLGAGALLQYRWGTHWGASVRGVLSWLPASTGYALVNDANVPIASAQPWAVQPSLELNASWHW